jgi:hypothetical protein
MVAFEVPLDSLGTHMIITPEVKDLFNDFRPKLARVALGYGLFTY